LDSSKSCLCTKYCSWAAPGHCLDGPRKPFMRHPSWTENQVGEYRRPVCHSFVKGRGRSDRSDSFDPTTRDPGDRGICSPGRSRSPYSNQGFICLRFGQCRKKKRFSTLFCDNHQGRKFIRVARYATLRNHQDTPVDMNVSCDNWSQHTHEERLIQPFARAFSRLWRSRRSICRNVAISSLSSPMWFRSRLPACPGQFCYISSDILKVVLHSLSITAGNVYSPGDSPAILAGAVGR
jgi:hypothetical protein